MADKYKSLGVKVVTGEPRQSGQNVLAQWEKDNPDFIVGPYKFTNEGSVVHVVLEYGIPLE